MRMTLTVDVGPTVEAPSRRTRLMGGMWLFVVTAAVTVVPLSLWLRAAPGPSLR